MGCESYIPISGDILFEGMVINDLKLHERAQLGITLAWQEAVRFESISVRDYLTIKKKGNYSGLSKHYQEASLAL